MSRFTFDDNGNTTRSDEDVYIDKYGNKLPVVDTTYMNDLNIDTVSTWKKSLHHDNFVNRWQRSSRFLPNNIDCDNINEKKQCLRMIDTRLAIVDDNNEVLEYIKTSTQPSLKTIIYYEKGTKNIYLEHVLQNRTDTIRFMCKNNKCVNEEKKFPSIGIMTCSYDQYQYVIMNKTEHDTNNRTIISKGIFQACADNDCLCIRIDLTKLNAVKLIDNKYNIRNVPIYYNDTSISEIVQMRSRCLYVREYYENEYVDLNSERREITDIYALCIDNKMKKAILTPKMIRDIREHKRGHTLNPFYLKYDEVDPKTKEIWKINMRILFEIMPLVDQDNYCEYDNVNTIGKMYHTSGYLTVPSNLPLTEVYDISSVGIAEQISHDLNSFPPINISNLSTSTEFEKFNVQMILHDDKQNNWEQLKGALS